MKLGGLISNLNLNAGAPPRVQPGLGEWGPHKVPTTRAKKWLRLWVSLAFLGAVTALFIVGWLVFGALNPPR